MCGLDQAIQIIIGNCNNEINPLITFGVNPGVKHYEAQRRKAGAHLLFNAFWLIPHFCVNLMYMRDPMHQIDNGVIITFLKAILRKYRECVENTLDKIGLAAKKLTSRLRLLLRKYTNATGHR